MLSDKDCYIVTSQENGKTQFLSIFWDISNNMWVDNWRSTALFETHEDATRAVKSIERFGRKMRIHEAEMILT